ncbi:unnamed protein product [Cylindrotheca closterium]|uniref:Rubisco LSMT substrate-binding domain-containing protein n=1 Tax=Cylindrotheca closterium TaxID=2856 RepID=A0AAD2FUV0_9STRA|nr:unnamed protein product [Cylindrotheca closterium]
MNRRRLPTFFLIQCCLILPNGGNAFVPCMARPSVFPVPAPESSPDINTPTTSGLPKRPSALFYNPLEFDDESEGKEGRMESVRRLQKSYYVNEPGFAPLRHGVLSSLPLWMEDYTELPGLQRVMDVRDPQLINLVLKIVAGPKPWYFGHVNKEDSDYDDDNSYDDDEILDSTIGTLMQISDYSLVKATGILEIGVQALGRFCAIEGTTLNVAGMKQVGVELLPDLELVEAHYHSAKEAIATFDLALNQNAKGAACAGAVAEAAEWHEYEFEPMKLKAKNGNADQGVSRLNAKVESSSNTVVSDAMEEYLIQSPDDAHEGECMLSFDDDEEKDGSLEVSELPPLEETTMMIQTFGLERDVWIQLDTLLHYLRLLDPKTNTNMPIPSQILALLPKDPPKPWPKTFTLTKYNQKMKNLQSLVSRNKSKLMLDKKIKLDTMEAASDYPALRRSRRLSYTVWILVEDLMSAYSDLIGTQRMILSRQDILEMTSISQRLFLARRKLEEINTVLSKVVGDEEV